MKDALALLRGRARGARPPPAAPTAPVARGWFPAESRAAPSFCCSSLVENARCEFRPFLFAAFLF